MFINSLTWRPGAVNREDKRTTAIRFNIDGLLPNKNGANSMWGNKRESERLVSLRRSATKAMDKRPLMKREIRLAVRV